MANTKQAKKRARQNIKRYDHNTSVRSSYRTEIKKVLHAIESGDKATALDTFKKAIPIIDKMVNKGIIHKNKAARNKSRLSALLKKKA